MAQRRATDEGGYAGDAGATWRSIISAALAGLLIVPLLAVLAGTRAAGAQAGGPDGQGPPAGADNPSLVVDNTRDGADANLADGVCATGNGSCTLRAAIMQANANPGSDRIEFAIGGSGVRQILIGSQLPTINDPTGGVTIDGYTQPGARPNMAAVGFDARIRVEVRRSSGEMFRIESAENTIRGLAIFGGTRPIELRGEGADGNQIIGNLIGTNAAASYSRDAGTGIELNLGPDQNRIGTPAVADRNLIGGSGRWGIRINHGETSQNRIQNNIIGLNPSGSADLGHASGVDIQWWTWGNLLGGSGPGEHNVISGNSVGIDLSHKATGNLVIGNHIGTTFDGRSANGASRNGVNVIVKDDAEGNYVGQNVIAGGEGDYAIVHKVNYTGGNSFVGNRIGVSVDGSDIGNGNRGMLLRGHDDRYDGNIFANIRGNRVIFVSNTSDRGPGAFEPDEQTARNAVRRGTFYGNGAAPIRFDASNCCPNPSADTPNIIGVGPGQVNGASTCAGCEVEVYVSGSVQADGTLAPGTGTVGFTWIGTVQADGDGRWSMASPLLTVGSRARVVSISTSGAVSTFSTAETIPARGRNLVPNPQQPTTPPPPPRPTDPPIYQPQTFTCSHAGGVLSWDEAGAPEYYVFAVDGGAERYLGGHSATSLTVAAADSYRVEHWVRGIATNARCDGPGGDPDPEDFSCSHSGGVLRWDDAGAPEYYVFATSRDIERYLGGHSDTSLTVAAADSYRVEHWVAGQATNAICDGDGGGPGPDGFSCAVTEGVLSWDDARASEYYVFATLTDGAGEVYLGGHSGTSLAVPGAHSYRVEHWVTGQATNANCDGGGDGGPFACAVTDGVLSWDDAGAPEYYVFATLTPGAGETYLGGHSTRSLAVPVADSYRVEHWTSGQATNAICSP